MSGQEVPGAVFVETVAVYTVADEVGELIKNLPIEGVSIEDYLVEGFNPDPEAKEVFSRLPESVLRLLGGRNLLSIEWKEGNFHLIGQVFRELQEDPTATRHQREVAAAVLFHADLLVEER